MHRTRFLIAFAASLSTLGSPTDDTIAWAPSEATLVRAFATSAASEMGDMQLILDGEERENPHADEMEVTITTSVSYVFVDEILETDHGRATHFERTFQTLIQERQIESSQASEARESTRISDLEGTTVVFEWNAQDEEYELEFKTDTGVDDSLLDDLVEDATLRAFLPEDAVEEGDTWEVDIEAYRHLMWPGGFLGLHEEETDIDEQRAEMTRALADALDGGIDASYDGVRDEDGVRVAVIQIEINAETTAEMEFEGPRGDYTQLVSLSRVVEGELLWDLESQRLHSFSAEAEGTEINEKRRVIEDPEGDEHEITQRITYEGTVTYSFSLEEE